MRYVMLPKHSIRSNSYRSLGLLSKFQILFPLPPPIEPGAPTFMRKTFAMGERGCQIQVSNRFILVFTPPGGFL